MQTLRLFADANLFLHYKPLHEIDWSILGDFDQIDIVVCRTVQREIDSLKDGREGRRSERARRTASKFLAIAQHGPQEQRPASPRVMLSLYDASRPKQDLADSLDYDHRDDQIIGYLAQFRADNPGVDARLLTRDSGPILTVDNLKIPFVIPDDDWRLPPETDDRERKINELNQQLRDLQDQNPRFSISCDQPGYNRLGHVEIVYQAFQPLDPENQNELLRRLGVACPPTVMRRGGVSPDAVRGYEQRDHPAWISKCRELLPEIHAIVQEQHFPEIAFTIHNEGSRPATNARVDIQAAGNFGLTSPALRLEIARVFPSKTRPLPPAQPQPTFYDIASRLKNLANPHFLPTSAYPLAPSPHHKEGFYYNSPADIVPELSISLTCDLWRHASEPEQFSVRLVPCTTDSKITGELTCTVHADNLTKPATFKLVVTLSPDYRPTLPLAVKWFTTPHPYESED